MKNLEEVFKTHPHITFKEDWEITPITKFRLGQCEALVRIISDMPMAPDYRKELLRVSFIKGAQATTAIEGNSLTEEEIEKIQEGETLPPSKEYQQIEMTNILEAFNELVTEVAVDKHFELVSLDLIKRFHKMVGKNLGENFQSIPGQFRENNVIVGNYKAPDYKYVTDLMNSLCLWLKDTFHFEKGQLFTDGLLQAIITHVYIAWIHPFSDGNGRTARLLEFYLLLRYGIPNIASHILSNHYNSTRTEYYRQLAFGTKNKNLTTFIDYAVLGFRDGLNEIVDVLTRNTLEITWRKYIYDRFADIKYHTEKVMKRRRRLMLEFPVWEAVEFEKITNLTIEIARLYANKSSITLERDLEMLVEMKLLEKNEEKYIANIDVLGSYLPLRK